MSYLGLPLYENLFEHYGNKMESSISSLNASTNDMETKSNNTKVTDNQNRPTGPEIPVKMESEQIGAGKNVSKKCPCGCGA